MLSVFRIPLSAVVLFLSLAMRATFGADDEPSLTRRLQPLIDAHRGRVAVAVEHLETGQKYLHHEDDVFPTASLIKFPVLVELYRQADQHNADLAKRLTLRAEDKAPGSGILTPHFSPGATLTLRDAARLMVAFSDNTATNLVLDEIGIPSTGETMQKLGCPNTRIHHKVFLRETTSIDRERSERYGLGSTTAAEMLTLLGKLHRRELVSGEASDAMLAHLKTCEDKQKFPRYLPEGMEVAFKTGSLDDIRTSAGILYTRGGPVALCVLSADNEDRRWARDNAGDLLCADIAREVNEAFSSSP
jgi:beta-lactamase class A